MKVKARFSSAVSLRRPSRVSSVTVSSLDLAVWPSKENSLSGLPEEILLDVLLFLRYSADQATFASCLLCCRQWYRICQPLLFKDIVLLAGSSCSVSSDDKLRKDKVRLAQRVNSFTIAARTHQHLFQSVTIRTASCNIDWPKWRPLQLLHRRESERNHWYTMLCRTLPQLSTLTTFSLKIGDNGQRVLWTPQGKVAELLDLLPPTVRNLEVDSMGADFATAGPSSSPSHICASLSRIIPRLHNLRIRLRFLCEALFDVLDDDDDDDDDAAATTTTTDKKLEPTRPSRAPLTSTLQSAVIVFTPRLGTIGSQSSLLQTRLCGTFERPQHGEVFDQISRRCRHLCGAGKFPSLRRFRLVDSAADSVDGVGYDVYDPLAGGTEKVTWTTAAELLEGDVRDFVRDAYSPPGWHATDEYNVKLAALAEGEGSWGDTSWRCRQPMASLRTM